MIQHGENGPTREDLERLEKQALLWDSMDRVVLSGLQEQYHLELPEPFSVAASELDMSDLGVVQALHKAVDNDNNLSTEEKYALNHELHVRYRMAHLANAPEAWND